MRRVLQQRFFNTSSSASIGREISQSNFGVASSVQTNVVSFVSGEQQVSKSVTLKPHVFARYPIRGDLIQRVVVWQLAKRRQGTAKSKNMAEVSGSTRKPRPQKGQGTARVGSYRAPQFRHGGRAFPKRPRSFDYPLPHRIRQLGLAHTLSAKYQTGKLTIADGLSAHSGKTNELKTILEKHGWTNVVFVVGEDQALLERAAFNLQSVDVLKARGINVYDLLRRDRVVFDEAALQYVQDTLLKDV